MIDVVNSLLNPPIGYHGVLAKALGNVPAAVMLSQGMYWQKVAESKGNEWFWVTADEWYNQTGITEESQKTARRVMKEAGFWHEKLQGLPAKLYFRIDAESLVAVISRYLETGIPVAVDRRHKKPDNTRSSDGKFRQQVTVNSGNEETKEEIKEKTKEETTFSAADAPVVELPVEEEKKKKDAPGPGAAPSWTKKAATIFDEVGAELSRAEGLDYLPFNWKVCNEQNFAHLKNLRKLAIEPDFKTKMGHEPNEEEFLVSFRAVMTLSWKYFRKIQKETNGGALHYTPESIYRSYNKIKTFKTNGTNNNGIGGQPSRFGQGGNQNGKFDPAKGY